MKKFFYRILNLRTLESVDDFVFEVDPRLYAPHSDRACYTIHVTQHVYNADGELEDVIDPLGRTDRSEFDDAGRTVKVTLNHGGTDTEVTETEFDQGRMSKQIAVNSTTGNQETVYTWGVAPAASKIASHDLLQDMTYPDGGVAERVGAVPSLVP